MLLGGSDVLVTAPSQPTWRAVVLIILEGVDLAGKTSIADRIGRHFVSTYSGRVIRLKAGQPDPNVSALDEYEIGLYPYREDILSKDTLVICDRWHVGELIYGPLLRGYSRLTLPDFERIEAFLTSLGAYRIIVQPPNMSTLIRRYNKRGDDLVSIEDIAMISLWYDNFLRTHANWFPMENSAGEQEIARRVHWARASLINVLQK